MRPRQSQGGHNTTGALTGHAYSVIRTSTRPLESIGLVIRERDFVPRNAGAAWKSQAFLLERELPVLFPPFEMDLCGQELDPERPEEDPERQNSGGGDANEGYFIE